MDGLRLKKYHKTCSKIKKILNSKKNLNSKIFYYSIYSIFQLNIKEYCLIYISHAFIKAKTFVHKNVHIPADHFFITPDIGNFDFFLERMSGVLFATVFLIFLAGLVENTL